MGVPRQGRGRVIGEQEIVRYFLREPPRDTRAANLPVVHKSHRRYPGRATANAILTEPTALMVGYGVQVLPGPKYPKDLPDYGARLELPLADLLTRRAANPFLLRSVATGGRS